MPCDIVAHDAATSCQPLQHSSLILFLFGHTSVLWRLRNLRKFQSWFGSCSVYMWSLLDKVGSSGINHP